MSDKHSDLPWRAVVSGETRPGNYVIYPKNSQGFILTVHGWGITQDESIKHAEEVKDLVIRACNNLDALVEALRFYAHGDNYLEDGVVIRKENAGEGECYTRDRGRQAKIVLAALDAEGVPDENCNR